MNRFFLLLLSTLATLTSALADDADLQSLDDSYRIQCGKLIYAGNRTAVCFADKFLERFKSETHLQVAPHFKPIKLDGPELFDTPFCAWSGEGTFKLSELERKNLGAYLKKGGFIISSPGCSDNEWDRSFRAEIKAIFPGNELVKIPMDHLIFKTVREITKLTTSRKSSTHLEGLFIDGRLALVYTLDGVNQAQHAKGCCCCGGDEIKQASDLNVNILTYALLY
jgi:Domain of unknown function (DUF4159)